MPGLVVFLGPTLSVAEARSVLDAVYLPPARQASVVSAVERHRPNAIGIIDGVFLQDLSVWHKELLYAMEQGVAVFGASSMGALRAAELASFGMRGVGAVYRQYAEGRLNDDDEVALVHASADAGYRKITEPMVNIRATLDAAERCELLSADVCKAVLDIAKGLYFAERSLDAILDRLQSRVDAATAQDVERVLTVEYVDIKKLDALELLSTMARYDKASATPGVPVKKSVYFDTLYHRDRQVIHGGREIPLSSVHRFAALHMQDFESLRFDALNRALAVEFARVLSIEPTEDEVLEEIRSFRTTKGLITPEALVAWLNENDLNEGEFRDLMREIATCRRLQRWWLSHARRRPQKTKVMLDQLRLLGRYSAVSEASALHESRHIDATAEDLCIPNDRHSVVRRHCRDTGFSAHLPLSRWADEVGFLSTEDLLLEMVRSRVARS